jgi:hypothetical protein
MWLGDSFQRRGRHSIVEAVALAGVVVHLPIDNAAPANPTAAVKPNP